MFIAIRFLELFSDQLAPKFDDNGSFLVLSIETKEILMFATSELDSFHVAHYWSRFFE